LSENDIGWHELKSQPKEAKSKNKSKGKSNKGQQPKETPGQNQPAELSR